VFFARIAVRGSPCLKAQSGEKEAVAWKIGVKDTTITGEWVLKVTGEGKWLVIMSRVRPYMTEVQSHGYMTFEKEYRFY